MKKQKHTNLKKLLALFLSLTMVFSTVPAFTLGFEAAASTTSVTITPAKYGLVRFNSDGNNRINNGQLNIVNDQQNSNTDAGILAYDIRSLAGKYVANATYSGKINSRENTDDGKIPLAYFYTFDNLDTYVSDSGKENTGFNVSGHGTGYGNSIDNRNNFLAMLKTNPDDCIGSLSTVTENVATDISSNFSEVLNDAIDAGCQTLYVIIVKEGPGSVGADGGWSDTKLTPANQTITYTAHTYANPEWSWESDYSSASATATFTCSDSGCGATKSVSAEITTDYLGNGDRKYTATVKLGGNTYTDTKVVPASVPGSTVSTFSEIDGKFDSADKLFPGDYTLQSNGAYLTVEKGNDDNSAVAVYSSVETTWHFEKADCNGNYYVSTLYNGQRWFLDWNNANETSFPLTRTATTSKMERNASYTNGIRLINDNGKRLDRSDSNKAVLNGGKWDVLDTVTKKTYETNVKIQSVTSGGNDPVGYTIASNPTYSLSDNDLFIIRAYKASNNYSRWFYNTGSSLQATDNPPAYYNGDTSVIDYSAKKYVWKWVAGGGNHYIRSVSDNKYIVTGTGESGKAVLTVNNLPDKSFWLASTSGTWSWIRFINDWDNNMYVHHNPKDGNNIISYNSDGDGSRVYIYKVTLKYNQISATEYTSEKYSIADGYYTLDYSTYDLSAGVVHTGDTPENDVFKPHLTTSSDNRKLTWRFEKLDDSGKYRVSTYIKNQPYYLNCVSGQDVLTSDANAYVYVRLNNSKVRFTDADGSHGLSNDSDWNCDFSDAIQSEFAFTSVTNATNLQVTSIYAETTTHEAYHRAADPTATLEYGKLYVLFGNNGGNYRDLMYAHEASGPKTTNDNNDKDATKTDELLNGTGGTKYIWQWQANDGYGSLYSLSANKWIGFNKTTQNTFNGSPVAFNSAKNSNARIQYTAKTYNSKQCIEFKTIEGGMNSGSLKYYLHHSRPSGSTSDQVTVWTDGEASAFMVYEVTETFKYEWNDTYTVGEIFPDGEYGLKAGSSYVVPATEGNLITSTDAYAFKFERQSNGKYYISTQFIDGTTKYLSYNVLTGTNNWINSAVGIDVTYSNGSISFAGQSSLTPVKLAETKHTLGHEAAVSPTCTVNGNKEYYQCSVCNKYYAATMPITEITAAATVEAALGHTWEDLTETQSGTSTLVSAATCTADAVYKKVCSVCDAISNETWTDTDSATGHTYNYDEVFNWVWVSENAAAAQFKCQNCEDVTAITGEITHKTTPANCTDAGYIEHTATVTTPTAKTYENTYSYKTTIPVDLNTHKTVVTDTGYSAAPGVVGLTDGSHCSACGTVITAQEIIPAEAYSSTSDVAVGTKIVGEFFAVVREEPTGKIIDSAPADSFTANGTYGILTINSVTHEATYTPKTMQFTAIDTFWLLTRISITKNDGTVNKYAYEEVKVIPSQSLYFEDDFEQNTAGGVTFTNSDNADGNYGTWTVAEKNPAAGTFTGVYDNCVAYSNNTAHKVSVSDTLGNKWPKATFTFAGTGFDIISTTDAQSGVFAVTVKDSEGNKVKSKIIDTYYGYTYGLLYYTTDHKVVACSAGEVDTKYPGAQIVYVSDITLAAYKALPEAQKAQYITNNAGKIYTLNNTGTQAYGWCSDEENKTSEVIYQTPVLSLTDLKYDTYTVTVEARFTPQFGHYNTDDNGAKFYNLCFDAVRIYNPSNSRAVQEAYAAAGEGQITYQKMKSYATGEDEVNEKRTGYILIDGGRAVKRSEIPEYTKISPNNELYLNGGEAIAFNLDTTAFKDIQIGMREANSTPVEIKISYTPVAGSPSNMDRTITISTATEKYYSLKEIFGVVNINGLILIENLNTDNGILSFTNLRWIANPEESSDASGALPTLTAMTPRRALSLKALPETDLSVNEETLRTEVNDSTIVITAETSDEVKTLVIKDKDGSVVEPVNVEKFAKSLEDGDVVEWKVTLVKSEPGEYVYDLKGVNEFGFEKEGSTEIRLKIDAPKDEITETVDTFFSRLQNIIDTIFNFIQKIFSIFGK